MPSTKAGIQKMLEILAGIESPIPLASWYLGLISVDNFTGTSADDTWASRGWEELTAYRVGGNPDVRIPLSGVGTAPAAGSSFLNGGLDPNYIELDDPLGRVKGCFLINSQDKGTSGLIAAVGHLTNPLVIWTGDWFYPRFLWSTSGPTSETS